MAKVNVVTALASARVLYERVRANKTACKALQVVGVCLLAIALILAYTAYIWRTASDKAVMAYETRLAEIKAEEEAAAAQDPYFIQLDQEATLGAKALEGVKLFHYDDASKKTILQGVANRVLNPAYPDTVEGVLSEAGQFDFYNPNSPATEENYWLCYEFFDNFHRQERLACSYDLVFMELGDKVILRDTLSKSYGTQTWWYGK